jgi:hypothetical protein
MSEPSLRELVQLLFQSSAAAFWSAFAATFAAVSSFMIWRIQRRNLMEMLRPELVLTGWSRQNAGQGDSSREEITFQIKNVGRGVALNVHLRLLQLDRPVKVLKADMETMRLPAIANGESVAASSPITLWWKNIDGDDLFINIPIRCLDTRGSRYETQYNLMISKLLPNLRVSDPLAPGVLGNRELAIVTPFWKVKSSLKSDRIRMSLASLRGRLRTKRPPELPSG